MVLGPLGGGGDKESATGVLSIFGRSEGVEDAEDDISNLSRAVGGLATLLEGLNTQSDRSSNSLNRLGASAGTGSAGLANLQKEIVETRALQEALENSTGDLRDALDDLGENTDYDIDGFEDDIEAGVIDKAADRLEESADNLADSVDDIDDADLDEISDADQWDSLAKEILDVSDGLDETFEDDPYNLGDLKELRYEFEALIRRTDELERERLFENLFSGDSTGRGTLRQNLENALGVERLDAVDDRLQRELNELGIESISDLRDTDFSLRDDISPSSRGPFTRARQELGEVADLPVDYVSSNRNQDQLVSNILGLSNVGDILGDSTTDADVPDIASGSSSSAGTALFDESQEDVITKALSGAWGESDNFEDARENIEDARKEFEEIADVDTILSGGGSGDDGVSPVHDITSVSTSNPTDPVDERPNIPTSIDEGDGPVSDGGRRIPDLSNIESVQDVLGLFDAHEQGLLDVEQYEQILAGEFTNVSESLREALMLSIDSAAEDSLGEMDIVDDPDAIKSLFVEDVESIDDVAANLDDLSVDALADHYGIDDGARIDKQIGATNLGEIGTATRFSGDSDPSSVLKSIKFDDAADVLKMYDSVNDFLDVLNKDKIEQLQRISGLSDTQTTEALTALFAASTDANESIDELTTLKQDQRHRLKDLLGEEATIHDLYDAYIAVGGERTSRGDFEDIYNVRDRHLHDILARTKRIAAKEERSLGEVNTLNQNLQRRLESILGDDATTTDLGELAENDPAKLVSEGLDALNVGQSLDEFEAMGENAREVAEDSFDALDEVDDVIPELVELAEEYDEVFDALSEMDAGDNFDNFLQNLGSQGVFNLREAIEGNRDEILEGNLRPKKLAEMVDPLDSRREIQRQLNETDAEYAQMLNAVQESDFADIFKKVSDPDEGGTFPTRETLALATMEEMFRTDPYEEENRMNRLRRILQTLYDPEKGFDVTLLQNEEALSEGFYPDVRSELRGLGFGEFTTTGEFGENIGDAGLDVPELLTRELVETENIGVEDFFGDDSIDISEFVSDAIGSKVLSPEFDDKDTDKILQHTADIFEEQLQLMMQSQGGQVAPGLTDTAQEAENMQLIEMFPDQQTIQSQEPFEILADDPRSPFDFEDEDELRDIQFEKYFENFFPLLRRVQETDRRATIESQGLFSAFRESFGDDDRNRAIGFRGEAINRIRGLGTLTPRQVAKTSNRLKSLGKNYDRLIPRLEASSFNLGAFNFRVESAVKTVGSLIAVLGPLVSLLGATAGAAITAAVGMASFVGVGAVEYLGQMENEMAGITDKSKAMEELSKVLRDMGLEALEPLQTARLGGDGMLPQQFFVQVIRRGLQLLNRFAKSMKELVELDVVSEEIEKWSEFLFGAEAGTGAFTDQLAVLLQKVLPMVGNSLRYVLGNFGNMLEFMAEISDDIGPELGDMFRSFITLFTNATYYGTGFIQMLLFASTVVTDIAGSIASALNFITGDMFKSEEILMFFGRLMGIFYILNKLTSFLTASMGSIATAQKVLTGTSATLSSTMLALAGNVLLLISSVYLAKDAWEDFFKAVDNGEWYKAIFAAGQFAISLGGVAIALANAKKAMVSYATATTAGSAANTSFAGTLATVRTGLSLLFKRILPLYLTFLAFKEVYEYFSDSDDSIIAAMFGQNAGGTIAAVTTGILGVIVVIYQLVAALEYLGVASKIPGIAGLSEKISKFERMLGGWARTVWRADSSLTSLGKSIEHVGKMIKEMPLIRRLFPIALESGKVAKFVGPLAKFIEIISEVAKLLPFGSKLLLGARILGGILGKLAWPLEIARNVIGFLATGKIPIIQDLKDLLLWISNWRVWNYVRGFFIELNKWTKRLEQFMGNLAKQDKTRTSPMESRYNRESQYVSTGNNSTTNPMTTGSTGTGRSSSNTTNGGNPMVYNDINIDANERRTERDLDRRIEKVLREWEKKILNLDL